MTKKTVLPCLLTMMIEDEEKGLAETLWISTCNKSPERQEGQSNHMSLEELSCPSGERISLTNFVRASLMPDMTAVGI